MVAGLALHVLTAPLSTACVERVMSFVRAMAHDDRFSMQEKSFELELFLRANRALIHYSRRSRSSACSASSERVRRRPPRGGASP